METINLELDILLENIIELTSLKDCSEIDAKLLELDDIFTASSGDFVSNAKEINSELKNLNSALTTLIQNTITSLENIKNNFELVDNNCYKLK